jgi:hypothetical protein
VVGEDSDLGRKRCVRKDSCLKHTIEKVLPEVEKPGRFYFRLRKKISSFKKPSGLTLIHPFTLCWFSRKMKEPVVVLSEGEVLRLHQENESNETLSLNQKRNEKL